MSEKVAIRPGRPRGGGGRFAASACRVQSPSPYADGVVRRCGGSDGGRPSRLSARRTLLHASVRLRRAVRRAGTRAAPGGTTTYTGFDLVLGGEPAVTPPDQQRPSRPGGGPALAPGGGHRRAALVFGRITSTRSHSRRPGYGGRPRRTRWVAATSLSSTRPWSSPSWPCGSARSSPSRCPRAPGCATWCTPAAGSASAWCCWSSFSASNAFGWWRARPRPALVAGDPERTVGSSHRLPSRLCPALLT